MSSQALTKDITSPSVTFVSQAPLAVQAGSVFSPAALGVVAQDSLDGSLIANCSVPNTMQLGRQNVGISSLFSSFSFLLRDLFLPLMF